MSASQSISQNQNSLWQRASNSPKAMAALMVLGGAALVTSLVFLATSVDHFDYTGATFPTALSGTVASVILILFATYRFDKLSKKARETRVIPEAELQRPVASQRPRPIVWTEAATPIVAAPPPSPEAVTPPPPPSATDQILIAPTPSRRRATLPPIAHNGGQVINVARARMQKKKPPHATPEGPPTVRNRFATKTRHVGTNEPRG